MTSSNCLGTTLDQDVKEHLANNLQKYQQERGHYEKGGIPIGIPIFTKLPFQKYTYITLPQVL